MTALASPHPTAAIGSQAGRLSGNRLHLNEGPIDLVIGAEGAPEAIDAAFQRASQRFDGLLGSLVEELPALRTPVSAGRSSVRGPVAKRMLDAVQPYADDFITPMAAVAGAVADEICDAISSVEGLRKIYVNDGGDIAFQLTPGETMSVGLVPELARAEMAGSVTVSAEMPIRGVATSGMDGRSLSLGIADAVTVLAASAAAADAAATLIANAVNADHPHIERTPATALDPDSDLGEKLVTVRKAALPADIIDTALSAGMRRAEQYLERGLIEAVYMSCCGAIRTVDATKNNPVNSILPQNRVEYRRVMEE